MVLKCIGFHVVEVDANIKIEFPKEYFEELRRISAKYDARRERIREMIRKLEKGLENLYNEESKEIAELQRKYLEKLGIKIIY